VRSDTDTDTCPSLIPVFVGKETPIDWISATQELREKQGIDVKQEMERLLAYEEQYKKEVETNKIYEKKFIEYESKISNLERQVDTMTRSMMSNTMSSSCIAIGSGSGSAMMVGSDSSTMSITTAEEDLSWSEKDYRLALWAWKRWRYHQMTSLRVRRFTAQ
jgi:kinesin family protein 1